MYYQIGERLKKNLPVDQDLVIRSQLNQIFTAELSIMTELKKG